MATPQEQTVSRASSSPPKQAEATPPQLEYRPCDCAHYVRKLTEKGIPDPGRGAPEFFESELWAASRFRQHVRLGVQPKVHVGEPGGSCLHVKAVTIDGVRYSEDG